MTQELEILKDKVIKLNPNLVILQYCVNDEHICNYIQPEHKWLNHLIHKSVFLTSLWKVAIYSALGQKHLLPFVEQHLPDLLLFSDGLVGTQRNLEDNPDHGAPHPPRTKDQVPARYHDCIGRDNLERYVKEFGDICRRKNILTLATGFIEAPDRNLYEGAGFRVYSFFDIFNGVDVTKYGYDPYDTSSHFGDNGNDFIGKSLARYLHENVNFAHKQ
jgi:hypothetical protein